MAVFPGPVRRWLKSAKNWFGTRLADRLFFPVWLLFQCLRHGRRAVILHRMVALGDILCTLPMLEEIRKRHPRRLIVFASHADYKPMLRLSQGADCIFGARSWNFAPCSPLRLVEQIYAPRTTDERSPNAGAQCHLMDDLARSCGITLNNRQPRLFPRPEFIRATQFRYGLADSVSKSQRIIGISCGRTWPVRMWDAAKWQQLIHQIQAHYEVTILQFGFTKGPAERDEFDHLQGVVSVTNRLKSDELVALIAGCQLLISIDSGPVHIAGAVGTPTVGLFGAVNPQYRLWPQTKATAVSSNVPCLFCHHTTPLGHWQSGCPHDIRCMKELNVATVFSAVEKMLSQLDSKSA